jgi:hypothetical protein
MSTSKGGAALKLVHAQTGIPWELDEGVNAPFFRNLYDPLDDDAGVYKPAPMVAFDLYNHWHTAEGRAELRALPEAQRRRRVEHALRPMEEFAGLSGVTRRILRLAGDDATPGLRGFSDKDILALPDPEWLMDKLIPAGGLIELVGRYGAAKTFLLIDWLMHIAAGRAWHGFNVKRGPCLYVYGEGFMKPRVAAWRVANRTASGDTVGVTFVPGTINLLHADSVRGFITQVQGGSLGAPPVVIALDTLTRMAPGRENDPEWGGAVLDSCGLIQRELGAAVILAHHTPWDKENQRPRGHTRVPDGCDAVFLIENSMGALKLTCQKMREGEQLPPQLLQLGRAAGSCVIEKGNRRKLTPKQKAYQYVLEHPGCSGREAARAVGGKADAVRRLLQAMDKAGEIEDKGSKGHQEWYAPLAVLVESGDA